MKFDLATLMENKGVDRDICKKTRAIFNNFTMAPGTIKKEGKGIIGKEDYLSRVTFDAPGVDFSAESRFVSKLMRTDYLCSIGNTLFHINDIGKTGFSNGVINKFDVNGIYIISFNSGEGRVDYTISFYDAESFKYFSSNKGIPNRAVYDRDFASLGLVPDSKYEESLNGSAFAFVNSVLKNPVRYIEKIGQGRSR